MTYQQERDQMIVDLTKAGFGLTDIRKLLRYASTLHRLAEAQCNGDWPFDNGERKVVPCPRCEAGIVPYRLFRTRKDSAGICPDCRTADLVRAAVAGGPKLCHKGHNFYVETDPVSHARLCCTKAAYRPIFSGDPRGCVLHLVPTSASDEDVQTGRERGIAIVGRY